MKKIEILYNGYLIEGILEESIHHPLTIWWIGILENFRNGSTLDELIKKNNGSYGIYDKYKIIKYLVYTMISNDIMIMNWKKQELFISEHYRDVFNNNRDYFYQKLLETRKIYMEWWLDGLEGELIHSLTALKFDYNYSNKINKNVIIIEPKSVEALIFSKKFDKSEFQYLSHGSFFIHNKKSSFIRGQLTPVGSKSIFFELQNYKQKRLLPSMLHKLEIPLKKHKPELFVNETFEQSTQFNLINSPLVEIYSKIEHGFLNFHTIDREVVKSAFSEFKRILIQKDIVMNYYKDSKTIHSVAGSSDTFFCLIREIIESKRNVKIIITTSFLNSSNINGGLSDIFNEYSDFNMIMLYGHANDDTPTQHKLNIEDYLINFEKTIPNIKVRLKIIPTLVNTHEKIILASNGFWSISSWNPGSSNPYGQTFETGVWGKDKSTSLKIYELILKLVGENEVEEFSKDLYELDDKKVDLENEYNKMVQAIDAFSDIFEEINWSKKMYENRLLRLIHSFKPFLLRTQIQFINNQQSREALIRIINKADRSLFFASDRISSSAIDNSFLNDLQKMGSIGNLNIAILWGREFENEKISNKHQKDQLKEAKKVIERMQKRFNEIKTGVKPMENHAKFIIVDNHSGLITSENLLSYGGEKTNLESREIGLYLNSPIIMRQILAKAILHRYSIFSTYSQYGLEWFELGNDIYHSFALIDNLDFDFTKIRYIKAGIVDELSIIDDMDNFDKTQQFYKLKRYNKISKFSKKQFLLSGTLHLHINANTNNKWIPIEQFSDFKINKLKVVKKTDNSLLHVKTHETIEEIMKDMVYIEGGEFIMGSNHYFKEKPIHKVKISKGFYMSRYIVTQKLWKKIMGRLPAMQKKSYQHPSYPIINIDYYNMYQFIDKLNGLPGGGDFDLPTEAEWEYCCRAGTQTTYFFGNDHMLLDKYSWNKRNSNMSPHEVGLKLPNRWGLFDMLGLVWENVKDDLRDYQNAKEKAKDPVGRLESEICGARGGGWGKFPINNDKKNDHFRCASRPFNAKTEKSHRLSFRLIRRIEKK